MEYRTYLLYMSHFPFLLLEILLALLSRLIETSHEPLYIPFMSHTTFMVIPGRGVIRNIDVAVFAEVFFVGNPILAHVVLREPTLMAVQSYEESKSVNLNLTSPSLPLTAAHAIIDSSQFPSYSKMDDELRLRIKVHQKMEGNLTWITAHWSPFSTPAFTAAIYRISLRNSLRHIATAVEILAIGILLEIGPMYVLLFGEFDYTSTPEYTTVIRRRYFGPSKRPLHSNQLTSAMGSQWKYLLSVCLFERRLGDPMVSA